MNDYTYVQKVYEDGGPCMDCIHRYHETETYLYGESTVAEKFRYCMVLDTGFGECYTAAIWKKEEEDDDGK